MLLSSFTLKNGILVIPMLLIFIQMGLVWTRIHHCVDYTPKKCFTSFVQSAVDARRQTDRKLITSVVAETMKLRASSYFGTQIVHCTWPALTKNLSNKKTHAAFDRKLSKKLDLVNSSLYEVEFAKAQIEYTEPITVGFFILQYFQFLTWEVWYRFYYQTWWID